MNCISELLKLKGDKEFFIFNYEDRKTAIEGGGLYKNYEYLIVLNDFGSRCGYVALPTGHPYASDTENFYKWDIECHGSLSFASADHALKTLLSIPCTDVWVGFDCGHHWGDKADVQNYIKYFGEDMYKRRLPIIALTFKEVCSIKDFQYVEKECMSIIDQLRVV